MSGTDWVAPGEGDTLHALVCAALDAIEAGQLKHPGTISPWLAKHPGSVDERTNLRLTGNPLNRYDLDRIAACKAGTEWYKP